MQPLLTQPEIEAGVERCAAWVRQTYGNRPLTIVGILTGSLVLLSDLIRLLDMPLRVALVQASSYRGATTTRQPVKINDNLLPDLAGREILVLDDIFDSGHTLTEVIAQLKKREPASIRSAVLLRKKARSQVSMQPDFVAFEIPDAFVVGYGLDYDDLHRNLPYIAVLEK
jgi:hypoxanthine phosphoribosyltransferase